MATYTVPLGDLARVVKRDMRARERRVRSAIAKTTRAGAQIVKPNVPIAFHELVDSIHATATQIIADAPHAAAVENGSRPHYPPLEPLIAWVKLRGMQALYGIKGQATERAHSFESAMRVGASLKALEQSTSPHLKRKGRYSDVDAPTEVAKAIQQAIGRNGTKPFAYMSSSLPEIMGALDRFVQAALQDGAAKTDTATSSGEFFGLV